MIEILNVRQLSQGYEINGHLVVLPTDLEYPLVEEWVLAGKEVIPLKTKAENDAEITAKANEIIYSKYPQIAQNKMSSQGLKLTLKIAKGGTLTTGVGSEQELLDSILTVDTWISDIRTIENTAIANGTLLADVVWGV